MAIHGIQPAASRSSARVESNITIEQVKSAGKLVDIVGSHPTMIKVFEQLLLWAPTAANVMITGETGCGKELIAQALHAISPRAKKPFIVLDCSTLSRELLESELFGHEKGAFTGAYNLHLGRFERANGGTLFLDEMSNMSVEVQAKLLRVLQSRTFERLGGNREIRVDVRVVAASNKSLFQCVEDGTFRQDLLYRLNTGMIELPSLRERASDIPLLATSFLESFRQQYMRDDVEGFSSEALLAMTKYNWPGNVRELRNVVERCLILAKASKIPLDILPKHIIDPSLPPDNLMDAPKTDFSRRAGSRITHFSTRSEKKEAEASEQLDLEISSPASVQESGPTSLSLFDEEPGEGTKRYDWEMQKFERYLLEKALEMHNGEPAKTASYLGLTKPTLQKKLKSLGIDSPQDGKQK